MNNRNEFSPQKFATEWMFSWNFESPIFHQGICRWKFEPFKTIHIQKFAEKCVTVSCENQWPLLVFKFFRLKKVFSFMIFLKIEELEFHLLCVARMLGGLSRSSGVRFIAWQSWKLLSQELFCCHWIWECDWMVVGMALVFHPCERFLCWAVLFWCEGWQNGSVFISGTSQGTL